MKAPASVRATALIGASILPLAVAAPPAAEDTASRAATVIQENQKTRAQLRTDLEASAKATADTQRFLEEADLLSKQPADAVKPPEPKPLEITPNATDTVVTCDGGMYFDADAGVLVYLGNVKVNDPRYQLTGADELKIFFSKKPPKATTKKETDTPGKAPSFDMGGSGGGLGDPERLVATGAVRILQKNTQDGKAPVEASGAVFTYQIKSGEIVISGGYPWVKQGTYYSRAKRPNETLRISRSGSFSTEGFWEMGGTLNAKP